MRPCGSFSNKFFTALFLLAIAIFVRQFKWRNISGDIRRVIKFLSRLELSYRPLPQKMPGPRVIVGFGGCVDLRIRAIPLLSSLGWHPPNATMEQLRGYTHTDALDSTETVLMSFASAFISGAAVERVLLNDALFDQLLHAATNILPEELRNDFHAPLSPDPCPERPHATASGSFSLGGNALVMAVRLAREGADVALAARLSPRMRASLPPEIRILEAPANFGLHSVPKEDVHLILEYDAGESWDGLIAPRANRYILVRDEENPRLSGLWPDLLDVWRDSVLHTPSHGKPRRSPTRDIFPDLVVVGGLQVMDQLNSAHAPATLSPPLFISNSPGLNEQELPNLASLVSNGTVTSISSAYPRAAHMIDAVRTVWASLTDRNLPRVNSAVGARWRRLSRIHLHTIAHQFLIVRRPAHGGESARRYLDSVRNAGGLPARVTDVGLAWPFTRAAVAKASLIANRYTCGSSTIDPKKTVLLVDDSFAVTADPDKWGPSISHLSKPSEGDIPRIHFNATDPVTCWTEPEPTLPGHSDQRHPDEVGLSDFATHVEICVSPVLVCSKVIRTVGAGDNISAGALRVQLKSRAQG
ncbi:unnamed protein product [Dicrocoelium dendriticum]|nr:unnamed protein product [Dicrocoelium dendriticum]